MGSFIVALIFSLVSFGAFAQEGIGVHSNANANSVGIGTTGPIVNQQGLTYAPHSYVEAPKRTLFPPNVGGIPNSGQLFVNPGESVNRATGSFQWHVLHFCGVGNIENEGNMSNEHFLRLKKEYPQFVVDRSKRIERHINGFDVSYQPLPGYTTSVARSLASLPVQGTEVRTDLPYWQKYTCLGIVSLIAENEKSAELMNISELIETARAFVANNITGFPHVFIVTAENGDAIAYQNEVNGSGRGFSLTPQISGFIGSMFGGLPFDFGHSTTNTGMRSRIGGSFALFSYAPDHSCACDAVIAQAPKKQPQARTTTQAPVSSQPPVQRVVIEIKTPNSK
ncbi:MAG TPA: hypothetical protein VFM02_04480 [Candidatus Paceibacterota bacterium]|nr:hypothetical protein [Candidatus Paceibacterota bacterium]